MKSNEQKMFIPHREVRCGLMRMYFGQKRKGESLLEGSTLNDSVNLVHAGLVFRWPASYRWVRKIGWEDPRNRTTKGRHATHKNCRRTHRPDPCLRFLRKSSD